MKLFIDTSNKKLILATIDYSNNVIDFSIQPTENNTVKIAVSEIEKFLNRNNLSLEQVDEYLFTIGPGSFTGVKVAINFIQSVSLTRNIKKYHYVDSFKLIENSMYDNTVIPFGKSKYYHKRLKSSKIEVIDAEQLKEMPNVNHGYDTLNKKLFEDKIKARIFKSVDNINKVKIKYLNTF